MTLSAKTQSQRLSRIFLACLEAIAAVIGLSATPVVGQTFRILLPFDSSPSLMDAQAGLVQGRDGALYGTAVGGGAAGFGAVFRIDPSGHTTVLHSFHGADGANPYAGLTLAADGAFYGTTSYGGAHGFGTVFTIDAAGTLTTLHSFTGADGATPDARLIQGSDGDFYGTTSEGSGDSAHGTVFRIGRSGQLTVLHSFVYTDGAHPQSELVQASDGSFYGTTVYGGNGVGTVYRIDSAGSLTLLHSFDVADGANPVAGLVPGSDGGLYGMTEGGGSSGSGTIFEVEASGNFRLLHSFEPSEGANPQASLVPGIDGNLYGTASSGGTSGLGTIFRVDPVGDVTPLHSFEGADGANPWAPLLLTADGIWYGTTSEGGPSGFGVVFELDPCRNPVSPVISATRCAPAENSNLTASVPFAVGQSCLWTITGGTIESGQGSGTITFAPDGPGTLVTLQVSETDADNCPGYSIQRTQVDFTDVPPSSPFHDFVCATGRNGVMAGCGNGEFCPDTPVLRSAMATLVLKAKYGSSYMPPAATGIFADVPPLDPLAPWIEELYAEGISGGCSRSPLDYCPDGTVTRATLAVFLLRAEHGPSFVPPPARGIFADMPQSDAFAPWIEEFYNEGLTGGCSADPLMFCPGNPVTRAQMAVFLTSTFDLR